MRKGKRPNYFFSKEIINKFLPGSILLTFLSLSGLLFGKLLISYAPLTIKNYPHYCNFSINLYGTSTKRDILFFSADGFTSGLEIAIKSLRSTGSQCRIILFSTKRFFLPPRKSNLFKELGVETVFTQINSDRPYVPHLVRYEFEKEWLLKHINEVDRILHSDAFDVFFQRDPFTSKIPSNQLLFILEPHMIRSCGWNLQWLSSCYNKSLAENIRHNYIICSGTITGGSIMYLKLLNLMISSKEWSKCWSSSMDQPILNYLVWSGSLKNFNISYSFTGCNDDFFTMQWCALNHKVFFNEYGLMKSIENTIPAVLHQYNRNVTLIYYLYSKCQVQPVPYRAELR